MPIRITGMNSGLDTEAIITQLASARSVKVNSLKKAQIKQQWTQDAWKDLNKKIYSFYTDTLSDMQYVGNYAKKKTTVSDTTKATVTTTGTAVNGTQYMAVESLAKAAYLTGGKLDASSADTKLSDLGFTGEDATIDVGNGKTVTLSGDSTLKDVVDQFKSAGLNANFDTNQQRLYISSGTAGKANDFNLTAGNAAGLEALSKLGLNVASDKTIDAYVNQADAFLKKYTTKEDYSAAMVQAKEDALQEEYEAATKDWQAKKTAYDRWTAWSEAADDDAKAALKAQWAEADGVEVDKIADPVETEDPGEAPVLQELSEDEKKDIIADAESYYQKMTDIQAYGQAADKTGFNTTSLFGFATGKDAGTKIDGSDAKIKLNGVEYTSSTNNFEINGLSITAQEESEKDADGNYKEFTLTTSNDTSGIKDMIKNFFTKYNELVNEMSKLYNAEANKDYEPLLSEEKSELSDKEVEEWENKVKESLLRKDNTLSNVLNSMVEQMSKGYEVTKNTINGPKTQTMYLQDFGIDTLGYFKAAENERNAYHIDGDEDDEVTSSKEDTLGYMIDVDPDAVSSFFSQLTKGVYSSLSDLMKSTSYSSAYTVYEDKAMRSEYSEYNDRIKTAEDKLNDYLDSWYARFSKMETAMANLNSKQSSLSGLFGG